MTKKSYLEDNKDVIQGFTKAIQKGLDYVFTHTDTSLNDLEETIKRYRDAILGTLLLT